MRQFGQILLDLEVLLDEMIDHHDVQMGDVLSLVFSHIKIHRPDAVEVYSKDNSNPVFKYCHKDDLK